MLGVKIDVVSAGSHGVSAPPMNATHSADCLLLSTWLTELCACVLLPSPPSSTVPLVVHVSAVRAASCPACCTLGGSGWASVCVSERIGVYLSNPWQRASSESPLDNEAEIKGDRMGERRRRGRRVRKQSRGRTRGSKTDGEEWW